MDKPIYTIVALSPTNIQEKFDILKQKVGFFKPGTKEISSNLILKDKAHFAIKRSFTLKEGISEKELLLKIDQLKLPKIKIVSVDVGVFDNSNYGAMVFTKIKLEKDLINLHLEIKRLIDPLVDTKNPEHEGDAWTPHITFTYRTPSEKINELVDLVKNNLLPFEFNMDKIYLLKEYNMENDERSFLRSVILN